MKTFTSKFIDFFLDLDKNNSKDWFDLNRKIYESEVKIPFKNFVTNMILAISQFDNGIDKDPKNAMFRINRDIRFSKDKTPYNTQVKAIFVKGGKKSSFPGYYLSLGPKEIHIGGGLYSVTKDNLNALRVLIQKESKALTNLINKKDFKETFGGISGEKYKRLPKEFQADQNQIPLLLNKQFYFMTSLKSSDYLSDENLVERLSELFKIGYPLNKFLGSVINNEK